MWLFKYLTKYLSNFSIALISLGLTWSHLASHGRTLASYGRTWLHLLSLRWSHWVSLGPTWSQLFALGLTRSRLISLGVTCSHLVSLRITCSHLVPLGLTCFHLFSLGLTSYHLLPLGSTWSHLVSLGLTSDTQVKKTLDMFLFHLCFVFSPYLNKDPCLRGCGDTIFRSQLLTQFLRLHCNIVVFPSLLLLEVGRTTAPKTSMQIFWI